MNPLITLGLAPVLVAQGLFVRRTVPVLPEPPGPRHGTRGSGPRVRLLILGDSAAAGVGALSQTEALSGRLVAALGTDRQVTWRLIARSGYTTRALLDHLREHPFEGEWDVAVISLGVNDAIRRRTPTRFAADQRELIAGLRARSGVRRFILSGLPPVHRFPALPEPLRWYLASAATELDQTLARIAASEAGCEYLSLGASPDMDVAAAMASDGFHPGPPAYALWASAAAECIRRSPSRAL
jgi:lysophospholipase L1-like esterase